MLLAPEGTVTFEFPHLLRAAGAPRVRHDLPRALLVLLAPTSIARSSARRARGRSTSRSCRRHGGSLRVFVAARRRAARRRSRRRCRSSRARTPRGSATRERYRASPKACSESKRALLDLLIGLRREGSRSSATERPGRGTRCSTTAGSARTSSTTRSTGTPTSREAYARDPDSAPSPEGIAETRPDVTSSSCPWNLAAEISHQLAYTGGGGGGGVGCEADRADPRTRDPSRRGGLQIM